MKKPTNQVVIDNIKTLMQMRGDTTYSLAKRSGVPQGTVSRIILGKNKISIDNADKIASAYGLDGWHLLLRNLNTDLLGSPRVERLYERYLAASDEGRDYIDAVAERESKYKPD